MSMPKASPAFSRKDYNTLYAGQGDIGSDDGGSKMWNKFGSLSRKKKIGTVTKVENEGKFAIDSPGMPKSAEMPPEEYVLEENEERSMIEPKSFEDPKVKLLIEILLNWINDELHTDRIIVQDIEEDLFDGQVLQKLLEKLTGERLDTPELTLSEQGQRNKLRIVLAFANQVLHGRKVSRGVRARPNAINGNEDFSASKNIKWSVESVHTKNIVSILHLLVALARHFRAPIRLPENVMVDVVIVQKRNGILQHRLITESLTSAYDDLALKNSERDAFDTLFDQDQKQLEVVKNSLAGFANKYLNRINVSVTNLNTQFADGVYLCLLMGQLENYFVPLYQLYLSPQSFEQKLSNVNLSFSLMFEAGLPKPKSRAEDIVNLDIKSTLRVLHNIFTSYKNTK